MPQSEARNPKLVTFFSYVLWSFPISYILLIGTFYNLPFSTMVSLFFSFIYLAHAVIAVTTGFALYRMKPYAWHFYTFHSLLMIAEQFYLAKRVAENHIVEIPLVFVTSCILVALWLVKSELRVPYFSPSIAWWESDPRYKISVPTEMTSADHYYRGDIMDISANGCFIKTKDPLKVDTKINIKFALFDHKFDCTGKVVWRTESGVTHPKGVGVRFFDLPKNVQVNLKSTVKKLKTLSRKYKHIKAEEKVTTMERKIQALLSERKG